MLFSISLEQGDKYGKSKKSDQERNRRNKKYLS